MKVEKCWRCWVKLTRICAMLLAIWGIAYTLNSFVKCYHYHSLDYPEWWTIKVFLRRLGVSFAAILFASTCMLYTEKFGCDKKQD